MALGSQLMHVRFVFYLFSIAVTFELIAALIKDTPALVSLRHSKCHFQGLWFLTHSNFDQQIGSVINYTFNWRNIACSDSED